jgi:hypothetical protein
MNRCLISSSAGAVSTHARGGLLVVSGEVVRTAVLMQLQKLIPPSDASVAQAQSFAGSAVKSSTVRRDLNRNGQP